MPHILKNQNLEIHIDLPKENYEFSRFDWTGKITKVIFKKMPLTTLEDPASNNANLLGKGLYNEFGIDQAFGYEDTPINSWFHKIGIGKLQKENTAEYLFNKPYNLTPANFDITKRPDGMTISCQSDTLNGFAYILKKEFVLYNNHLTINYQLDNTGNKVIKTSEYVHNFMAINNTNIGTDYALKLPFSLQPQLFNETVNPENKVVVGKNEFEFNGTPNKPFFFSNLNGGNTVKAHWELYHTKLGVGISETGSFSTSKVNLWGWKHVISPELFYDIHLNPNHSTAWSRTYEVFEL